MNEDEKQEVLREFGELADFVGAALKFVPEMMAVNDQAAALELIAEIQRKTDRIMELADVLDREGLNPAKDKKREKELRQQMYLAVCELSAFASVKH